MDPIFHLLATNLYAKDERWRDEALFFSLLPDLGLLLITIYIFMYLPKNLTILDAYSMVPQAFVVLYFALHSLVVFAIAALVVWRLRPRLLPAMSAWLLHILIDIPVHAGMFATRFLYPVLPDVRFEGASWGEPWVLLAGYSALLILYVYSSWRERRKHYLRERWRADWLDRLVSRANALISRVRIHAADAKGQDIEGAAR